MDKNTSYGFLCPGCVARNMNRMEERMSYVEYAIEETQLPCYLAPIVDRQVTLFYLFKVYLVC